MQNDCEGGVILESCNEDVIEIRNQTILVFYLLLGALKFDDNEYQKLLPYHRTENKVLLEYGLFEKWMNDLFGGNLLLNHYTNIVFDVKPGSLNIYTYEYIVDGIPKNIDYPNVSNDLKWDVLKEFDYINDDSAREAMWVYYISTIDSLLKKYLVDGKYRSKLFSFAEIMIGFSFNKFKKFLICTGLVLNGLVSTFF